MDETHMPEEARACEHYWMSVSPAGTSESARLCMGCGQPDPDWLNALAEGVRTAQANALRDAAEKFQYDATHAGIVGYFVRSVADWLKAEAKHIERHNRDGLERTE